MKKRRKAASNKYETVVRLTKQFLKGKGFSLEHFRILYGEQAAEMNDRFDADYEALLVMYPVEYKPDFDEYYVYAISPIGTVKEDGPPLMEELIDYLRQSGIDPDCWYDYLDEESIIIYFNENIYGKEGRARREGRFIELSPEEAEKLRKDLGHAKQFAETAIVAVDDRGSCNLDTVCLVLENYGEEEIKSVCAEVGLYCHKFGNHMYPSFHISGPYGFGMKNTVFCRAFAEYLEQLGYDASVSYKID